MRKHLIDVFSCVNHGERVPLFEVKVLAVTLIIGHFAPATTASIITT
jgi:hypothetical protein